MALPATHVRFALEKLPAALKPHSHAYIAGTLYPDSRTLTGLPREKNHADTSLAAGFATSPFRPFQKTDPGPGGNADSGLCFDRFAGLRSRAL